ncbi:hypothetical protein [Vibrio scophthalmi]|uniref:Uncharacterized protein n=1 Tax=Vibrio scophthalmi TaxID=45658 RepID=A0A1E3WKS4_9VIBR|nr:hypothetical protein [Vibrio scophthalmi]ODS10358.1 hypothetical protein VSF3289_00613 [Vibrio scophthalmi]
MTKIYYREDETTAVSECAGVAISFDEVAISSLETNSLCVYKNGYYIGLIDVTPEQKAELLARMPLKGAVHK